MRFQAAAVHVDRGRVLRQSGDIAGALNQFTRALQIDPGNESAAQEIQITRRPGPDAGPPPMRLLDSAIQALSCAISQASPRPSYSNLSPTTPSPCTW